MLRATPLSNRLKIRVAIIYCQKVIIATCINFRKQLKQLQLASDDSFMKRAR